MIGIVYMALILASAFAVSRSGAGRVRLVAFALVVIAADVSLAFDPAKPLILMVGALRTAFLGLVMAAILLAIVREQRVTHDTILGGVTAERLALRVGGVLLCAIATRPVPPPRA